MHDLYKQRYLSNGYPELNSLGVDYFKKRQKARTVQDHEAVEYILDVILCVENLVDLTHQSKDALVVGCGPSPIIMRVLRQRSYNVVGIDILSEFVTEAADYLGDDSLVLQGRAENLPFEDQSKRIIFMESVLEHVVSPSRCLMEAYRVLKPGGVLYIATTNRLRFRQGEFNIQFYQWLPALVKESMVFHHLHYQPTLANYTPLPAVHWFTFSDLCSMGRNAGFQQFYSKIDLVNDETPWVRKSRLRRLLYKKVRCNPWFRALALTQLGSVIFMLKKG